MLPFASYLKFSLCSPLGVAEGGDSGEGNRDSGGSPPQSSRKAGQRRVYIWATRKISGSYIYQGVRAVVVEDL
jgi:hypothetical protein